MTKARKPSLIKYLTVSDIEIVYSLMQERFTEIGEPLPPYDLVNRGNIETLIALPQTSFFGFEQYPTLESKAAILFYKINKGHIFPNGNKRMSVACLLIFLQINGIELQQTADDLTRKAIALAESDPNEFDTIKKGLEEWLRINTTK